MIRFLLDSFVSSSLLVLLRYSFLMFFFISTCMIVSTSKILKYLYVSYSPRILIFSWFDSSIPSVRWHLPVFITSKAHFQCQIPSLCLNCVFSQCVLEFPVLFHFYKQFDVVNVDTVIDFLWRFSKFVSGWTFSWYVVSDIIAIINKNGDSAFPWNIPFWIFASAQLFPPTVNFPFHVFMVFSIKFIGSSDILYILRQFNIPLCGPCVFVVNPSNSLE